jgi:hypothetical protein
MKTLNRIFYIYSDASVAVLMFAGALVEIVCSFFVPELLLYMTIPASVFFVFAGFSLSLSVYRDAKKSNII